MDKDELLDRKVGRCWGVLILSLAVAFLAIYEEWHVVCVVAFAIAFITFIVIDMLNSSGGGGFTPTSYGAC